MRGGAFKPRTSPYSFQGLKSKGLDFLLKAKQETGMPIVTEIMSASHLDLFKDVDIIQIGAKAWTKTAVNEQLYQDELKCSLPICLLNKPISVYLNK